MMDFDVTRLRCEYLVDPDGLDERVPRLGWELEGDRRGLRQTAYRIRVAG
jgi:alpha-L-rhamnosidase